MPSRGYNPDELGAPQPERVDTKELCRELIAHAEYCGWGDNWEREGAKESGLIARAMKWLEENPE